MSSPSSSARRKPPAERRAEILEAAARVALSDGLEQVTARRVADQLGVYPGLINHYFPTAAGLAAEAFVQAAGGERDLVYAAAVDGADPLVGVRELLALWMATARDPISLLWLDAWQASRRRPELLEAVIAQMEVDASRLGAMIQAGINAGAFTVTDGDANAAATQIMALVDGLSVHAAVRDAFDVSPIQDMVLTSAERLLGVTPGSLIP